MQNYAPLIACWAALPAATTAAAVQTNLATIAARTVAGPSVDVPISAVVSYLALNGKLVPLQAYASNPPTGAVSAAMAAAKDLLSIVSAPRGPEVFQTSQPTVLAAITAMLAALASDPLSGIVAADQTALLALAATTMPYATAPVASGGLGLTANPNVPDLVAAGIVTEAQAQSWELG